MLEVFDSIKETIENAGFGRKAIMKRYIKTFTDNNLEEGESLLAVASPNDKPTKLLFVTNQNVSFYNMLTSDGKDDVKAPISAIISCEIIAQNGLAAINLETKQGSITIHKVLEQIAGQIKDTIEELQTKQES
ncbi:hypothetical protein [Sediminibacillus albus]|uniref:Uncharacterized protein n=1 Tax=Sediminibacillus albus TaxID=407036 RepID=A0A1G8YCK0_9BACI|nr:hypothetical protein [Sediminibacillus albus]SDK00144.1 hypothetical protein SAMN05216243_1521 [Sediminibacillus albus]